MSKRLLSVFGVVPKRIGGTEIFARELGLQLAAAGWAGSFCFAGEPTEAVRRFLDAPGISIETIPGPSGSISVRSMASLLGRLRPDILHLHFLGVASPYPWLARCYSVDRIFLTDHISRPEGYVLSPAPGWKRAIRQVINRPVDGVVGVSDFVVRCVDALGAARPGRAVRVYNGVDLDRPCEGADAFRRKHSIPGDRPIVLQVSWTIPEKGVVDLLDAARIALGSGVDAQFVIAGEGPNRPEYMQYAADIGIAERVTWTGLVEDPFREGVYAAANVACQLSRWEEAFGWVITEAMACRQPIVATRVGGIPEIVRDGVSGFLVPVRSPAIAAERIVELLRDAPLRRRMGEAGRNCAVRLFDVKRNVAQLLEIYGIERATAAAGGS